MWLRPQASSWLKPRHGLLSSAPLVQSARSALILLWQGVQIILVTKWTVIWLVFCWICFLLSFSNFDVLPLQVSCQSEWLTASWECSLNSGSSVARQVQRRTHGNTSKYLLDSGNIASRSALFVCVWLLQGHALCGLASSSWNRLKGSQACIFKHWGVSPDVQAARSVAANALFLQCTYALNLAGH